jgi:TRAP-type C4-dicarboxylate transport system permease small subunit
MSKSQKDTQEGTMNTFKKISKYLSLFIDRFEVTILAGSTAFLAILLIINVIARNFAQGIYYAEEVSKLFVILITFTGTSFAARKARHIRMGAILELLPTKVEKVLVILISIVSAIVMFVLAYHAFSYMNNLRIRETKTEALGAPYWYFIIIAPIALFTSGVQYVRTIFKNFKEKDVWLSPEQQSEFEDEVTMMENVMAESDVDAYVMKESK